MYKADLSWWDNFIRVFEGYFKIYQKKLSLITFLLMLLGADLGPGIGQSTFLDFGVNTTLTVNTLLLLSFLTR